MQHTKVSAPKICTVGKNLKFVEEQQWWWSPGKNEWHKKKNTNKETKKIVGEDKTQRQNPRMWCGKKMRERERERERERLVWRLTCSGLNLVQIGEIQHQQQGLLSSCGREGHASGFFFFFYYEESSECVIERRDSRSKNTIALCKPSSWFISCLADLLWLAALSHPLLTLVNGAWFRCNLVHLSLSQFISIYPSSSSSSPLHHDLCSAKKDVNLWWWVPKENKPSCTIGKTTTTTFSAWKLWHHSGQTSCFSGRAPTVSHTSRHRDIKRPPILQIEARLVALQILVSHNGKFTPDQE